MLYYTILFYTFLFYTILILYYTILMLLFTYRSADLAVGEAVRIQAA